MPPEAAAVWSRETSDRAAAAAGGNPPLLVAVDQEGGPVRRLPDGPPRDSPAQMRTAGQAGTEGAATGSFLHWIGIDQANHLLARGKSMGLFKLSFRALYEERVSR